MGRTICVWLIACLALTYAVPVPGPASNADLETDLLNLIRNAKPEDNDIDLKPAYPQTLISDSYVKDHEPTKIDIPEPQDPIPHDTEEQELPQSEEPQEIQPVQEKQQVQDTSEQDQEEHEPEKQIESEPISVPEEDQVPTKQEVDEISVPEVEYIEIELEEVIPVLEEQRVPIELGEVQLYQVPEKQQVPLEEQIISVLEDQIFPISEVEEPSPVNEEEEAFPLIEEEIIIPVYEEENPIEPYEVQIIPIHRDDTEFQPEIVDTMMNFGNEEQLPIVDEIEDFPEVLVVDLEEVGFNQPISDEPMIPGFVKEEIQPDAARPPVEIQTSAFDSFVPPYFVVQESQEDIPFMHGEQLPIVDETEYFPEVLVVGLEEAGFNQPISDEPMIPGFVKEEIQPDAARPPFEIQNSAFDSFVPPYFVVEGSQEDIPSMHEEQLPIVDETDYIPEVIVVGLEEAVLNQPISDDARPSVEIQKSSYDSFIPPYFVVEESQEDIPSMHDESQGPVYFDAFADPESSREDSFESLEDHMEEPVNMPVEEKVPFVIIGASGPQLPNHRFDRPVFPITPTGHPYGDDALGDYYIPGSNFHVEDARYENPEVSFLADEDELHEIDDSGPEYQTSEEENAHFPDDPILEIFPPMEVIPEAMTPEHSLENFDDEMHVEEDFIHELPYPDQQEAIIFPNEFPPKHNFMVQEQNPTFEDITDILDSEIPEGLEETIFMINPQGIREDSDESTLEIIHMSNPPQNPGNTLPFDLADFIPKEKITPIIIDESYWIPENHDQQAIIFPNEFPPKHNLPVFPHQWSEENFFHHPNNDHVHSHDLNLHIEAPSYGPVPQHPPMMEQPQTAFDMPPNANISPKIPDFMPPSEVSDMPREDMLPFSDSHNVNMNSPSGHLHLPDEFHKNSRFPFYPKRFNLPSGFELPSLPDITFQKDFHGPNTFPLNFRRPEFTPNLNPYKQRIVPENINRENIYPEIPVTPNHFQQRLSNLPSFSNSMPSTPNRPIIFSMPNEPRKMLENPREQNMNMNLHVFRTPSMPMNPQRFQKQQQQYDIEVSFVPYENSYNFHPYVQHGHDDFNYPYANNFDTYQESSYSVPPYGGSNSYPNQGGLYSSSPLPDRYGLNYDYRPQHSDYHPYNYPTPTW